MLTFRHVTYRYDKKAAPAVRDLNFEVADGDCVGLLGRTGSGKTTVLKLACGILSPSDGSIGLNGSACEGKRRAALLRRHVGIVMQYPERQLFAPSVFEEVAFGPRNLGLSEMDVKERVYGALSAVGFACEEIGKRNPLLLSGGEKRRVALASTLALRPKALALDEPFVGLPPRSVQSLIALLQRLRDEGAALIIATHALDEIAPLADRLLIMDEGKAIAEGTPRELFTSDNREALIATGLDVPRITALAWRLREKGLALTETIIDEDELIGELAQELGKRSARKSPQ